MPENPRDVLITGIGVVSCLGEGSAAHWDALDAGRTVTNTDAFAPYVIHPLAPVDLDRQIPKKGDQRQMEPWQRIGVYAAGLALEDAGIKGNAELLARTDLIVAARGGERDPAVDSTILTGMPKAADPAAFLNERLLNDLRPTLFLAQLSNLMAGNISIVHGVTGSSRTLMGEEAASVDAIRIAAARIGAGQGDIMLVGGACNAERKDQLMHFEFRGFPWRGEPAGVWERGPQRGFAFGSLGAFVVLESRAHAAARGARAHAQLGPVLSERSRRADGSVKSTLEAMYAKIAPSLRPGEVGVVSGATGVSPPTAEERAFIEAHSLPVRASGTYVGHSIEAQFVVNIAVAALAVEHGRLYAAHDRSGVEQPFDGPLRQAIVTGVGHWRGEGMALVEAA